MQNVGVQTKSFVRNYQNRGSNPAAPLAHKRIQLTIDFFFRTRINGRTSQPAAQPFFNFFRPIFHETRRANNYRFINRRICFWTLALKKKFAKKLEYSIQKIKNSIQQTNKVQSNVMHCKVFPKPISSAIMQPKPSGIRIPVTQSYINLTPSRWWGRKILHKTGSTTTWTRIFLLKRNQYKTDEFNLF